MLKIHAPHSYNIPNHRQKPILFPTLTLALYYLTWPEFSTRTVAVFNGKIFSDRLKKNIEKEKRQNISDLNCSIKFRPSSTNVIPNCFCRYEASIISFSISGLALCGRSQCCGF
ncbi:hypothetical protein PanWU01x14_106450 [Parasponia andersonii]|uniref:Uncharacterized protein n=1 Tax=Parasponia andersonii TaxID=3476 RepID=A0A2P5D0M6_PARAD|nr:hypothetical protein PanWU01x14_106450 [Parasponia andersonii]